MRPDYGIDAPGVMRRLAIQGGLIIAAAIALRFALAARPALAASFFRTGLWMGGVMAASAAFMYWSSVRGKFGLRDRLMKEVPWTSSERVLDIGCGRGLALIGAAKRLQSGRAFGIDLWSLEDLSGNSADATKTNIELEGVSDRVRLLTGDARALPFPSESFDAVVSMTAIHNIPKAEERTKAIAEAYRVLRTGGHLAMFDIFHGKDYARDLQALGAKNVRTSGIILLWMIPGRRIYATK